ncbi:MAG TPA: FAD-dependent oxidoreductase [Hyphomicrobiales bacterium]|nr:FAD-dependent oxidoreductase [Hyphomicrobiales bacterium]
MTEPIVIVGAGQAGIRAAETLRKMGWEDPIIMYGDEAWPPYQRPPLSKKFLAGELEEEQLLLQGEAFYERNAIEFIPGSRVLEIDPAAHQLDVSGRDSPLKYSKLLLTTGCRPRALAVPGADDTRLETLRTITDVNRIRGKIEHCSRPAIIGGGYIGLEVAAVLQGMGKQVTVLEAQDRLLGRVTSPEVAEFFRKLHGGHGVDIRLNASVIRLETRGKETMIVLDDESEVAADFMLVAIGAIANDELARQAGLHCYDGIMVDELCKAAPDIYAAGDCTRFPLPRYGRSVRLESVQNANDQARAAAQSMLGEGDPYNALPWFWSDQYDVKFQIAGLSDGYDALEMDGDPETGSFSVSYYRDGKLIAVDAINAARAHMMARRTLA